MTLNTTDLGFYVDDCLPACMYVQHVHAVLIEARRGRQIPWNLNHRVVSHQVDAENKTHSGSLQEQQVLLTTKPCLKQLNPPSLPY